MKTTVAVLEASIPWTRDEIDELVKNLRTSKEIVIFDKIGDKQLAQYLIVSQAVGRGRITSILPEKQFTYKEVDVKSAQLPFSVKL